MQQWVWQHAQGMKFIPRSYQDDHPRTTIPTTTRAMISDPKLPFDSAPTGVETPAEVSSEVRAVSVDGSPDVSAERNSISRRPPSTARLWLRRVGVLLFVFLCATFGVMLMIVPWRPEWSDNPLLLPYPTLRDLVGSGFVRGLVTGLGLLNVWIGFWEALQYRED
jgi:hypothetical protein